MLLRRATPLALALAAIACEPSVPYDPTAHNPSSVDYAGFDPTGNPPSIPLPNDLALQDQAIAAQNPTQAAVLRAFKKAGGFPNDQEVPITIDFVRETLDPNTGAPTRSAPDLDVSSINPTTLLIIGSTSAGSGAVAYDAPKASDYVVNGDHGTLTLHKSPDPAKGGSRRYAPGQYLVAVRGGPNGVKVNGSTAGVQPQAAMYLLLQDKDLSLPENQGLLPGATRAEKAAAGQQLESLRKLYLLPFAAVDQAGLFNHREIATMGTFAIAPATTHVETDPSAGLMPLPSDFLMGPNGHLLPELAGPTGPFKALGPGLATLDGFSTTAMILAQTSGAIQANTVADGVFIYELAPGATPPLRRLLEIKEALTASKKPEYAAEPSPIVQSGLSLAIGLQPAVPAPLAPSGVAAIPPLKEGTTYVVLVTDKVKDLNGAPLTRSTLGQILLLDPSLSLTIGGKSAVSGVSDAQAAGLDQMRVAINGAAQFLAAEKSITRDHVVMGYTFRTQTMKETAVKLTALPYSTPSSGAGSTINPVAAPKLYGTTCFGTGTPAPCPDGVVTDVFDNYGVDKAAVPNAGIGTIVEAKIVTFNGLDDATGAFKDLTTTAPAPEVITALVALPPLSAVAGCSPASLPCTVPLAIFRHGLGGGRGEMLTIADTLNAQGIAVASIDAAKHGDRSFCMKDSECTGTGAKCTAIASMTGQGDPAGATPGQCTVTSGSADFARRPVLCPAAGCATVNLSEGIPLASGNFVVGANLFRTRDTLRQDLIDQSQLIRVLAPNPAGLSPNAIFTAATGLQIDPSRIWYVGQSLGASTGTMDVAANPRIGKAAFAAGGGTLIDVLTNSPVFAPNVSALLASLGITPGSAAYLQFVNVAKWALDPADPLNYATNLSAQTLPSPLSGNAAPAARKVLTQVPNCALFVPNGFSIEMSFLSPTDTGAASALEVLTHVGAGGADYTPVGGTSCPVPEAAAGAGAVPDNILVNWGCLGPGVPPSPVGCTTNASLSALTGTIQSDIAAFFNSDTIPPASRNAP